MATKQELLESLSDMSHDEFAAIMGKVDEAKNVKPSLKRMTVYAPPDYHPVKIWGVDYRGWKAAGALDSPPKQQEVLDEDKDIGDPETFEVDQLRADYQRRTGNPAPSRARSKWFKDHADDGT